MCVFLLGESMSLTPKCESWVKNYPEMSYKKYLDNEDMCIIRETCEDCYLVEFEGEIYVVKVESA